MSERIQISSNFYLDEFTRSEAAARNGIAIDVDLRSAIFQHIEKLCEHILQPIRDALGPVHILSGYRPPEVNRLVGGAPSSDHLTGSAADIVVSGHTPLQVAQWIASHIPNYRQVIFEFGQWTHVSIWSQVTAPACEMLTAVKVPRLLLKPKTVYVAGLWPIDEALRRAA